MQVGLSILRKIKVDDNVHGLNIDTAGEEIRANQIARYAVSEIVEHFITVLLEHFGVRIEAGVAEFGDFLGQKFDSIGGIAEDDGLVDL